MLSVKTYGVYCAQQMSHIEGIPPRVVRAFQWRTGSFMPSPEDLSPSQMLVQRAESDARATGSTHSSLANARLHPLYSYTEEAFHSLHGDKVHCEISNTSVATPRVTTVVAQHIPPLLSHTKFALQAVLSITRPAAVGQERTRPFLFQKSEVYFGSHRQ